MIKTPSGQTYVKSLQTLNPVIHVGGTTYCFKTKQNVCIALIEERHLEQVLAMKKECCSGSKKPKFFLANELDVQRWSV